MGVNHLPYRLTSNAGGDTIIKKFQRPGRKFLGVKFTNVDFANTADITVRTTESGQTLFTRGNSNSNFDVMPRRPVHDNAGNALLYADGGEPIVDYFYIGDNEDVEIVVADPGASKSGDFDLLFEY